MRCSGHIPPVGGRGDVPRHTGETMSHGWPGNASGDPPPGRAGRSGQGEIGLALGPCLGYCPCDPTLDKW